MTNPSTPIPTPRVDALDFEDQMKFPGPGYGELWKLARNLERELTAARSKIAFLTAFADPPDVKTGETSRSQLERTLQQALAELAAARDMNEKLLDYVQHRDSCDYPETGGFIACTCGLEELLK